MESWSLESFLLHFLSEFLSSPGDSVIPLTPAMKGGIVISSCEETPLVTEETFLLTMWILVVDQPFPYLLVTGCDPSLFLG